MARGADWVALRLDGVIDEHSGLVDAPPDLGPPGPLLVIDLGGVVRINSVGVRDWILWTAELKRQFSVVALCDCPPVVMSEVNLVRNFAEGLLITTFRVPYFCDHCGRESTETLDARALGDAGQRRPPAASCGKPACANTLDDADDNAFAFLEDRSVSVLPEGLGARIDAARAALSADPPRPQAPNAVPASSAPHEPAAPERGRLDVTFLVMAAAMLLGLGVLLYLISTLE